MWAERGGHQWTCQSRWEQVPETLSLHKEVRQLSKTRSWRSGLPHGKAHRLVVQWQVVSSENRRNSNIIQTEQAIFSYLKILCFYIKYYICVSSLKIVQCVSVIFTLPPQLFSVPLPISGLPNFESFVSHLKWLF